MKFGVFDHMDRAGTSIAKQYDDRLALVEAYEQAGFFGYYLAEHHSTPLGLAPSPSVFLAAASQRTSRIRLGALVFPLTMYHPLRIFEEICMLDNLSGGRLDVGIGRGVSPVELGFYGVNPDDAQALYEEVTQIIRLGMTSKEISHEGKYFQIRDVPVEMSPMQDFPNGSMHRLPIWYGAASPDTAERVAERGYNLMCNGPAKGVRAITDRYRASWIKAGRSLDTLPLCGMSRHVVIAETSKEARDVAGEAYEHWYRHLIHLWRVKGIPFPLGFPSTVSDAIDAGFCLIGSPAEVRDLALKQVAEADVNFLLCRMAFGNLPREVSERTATFFQREIMPAFESRVA